MAAPVRAGDGGPVLDDGAAAGPTRSLRAAMEAVRRGSEAALQEVYAAVAPAAFGAAHRILEDRDLAQDVVAETFFEVWRSAARFDPARGSVTGWVVLIARSRAIDLLRARRATGRPRHLTRELSMEIAGTEGREGACRGASDAEDRARVRGALAELPWSQRRVLEGAFFDGATHTELSRRLGLPLGTVKGRIRLGLRRLRASLAALEEER